MNGRLPEFAPVENDSAARRPPVIHKVLEQYAGFLVKPAMCGFIIKPSNAVSMPQAIVEQAEDCQACLTICLELDLARS